MDQASVADTSAADPDRLLRTQDPVWQSIWSEAESQVALRTSGGAMSAEWVTRFVLDVCSEACRSRRELPFGDDAIVGSVSRLVTSLRDRRGPNALPLRRDPTAVVEGLSDFSAQSLALGALDLLMVEERDLVWLHGARGLDVPDLGAALGRSHTWVERRLPAALDAYSRGVDGILHAIDQKDIDSASVLSTFGASAKPSLESRNAPIKGEALSLLERRLTDERGVGGWIRARPRAARTVGMASVYIAALAGIFAGTEHAATLSVATLLWLLLVSGLGLTTLWHAYRSTAEPAWSPRRLRLLSLSAVIGPLMLAGVGPTAGEPLSSLSLGDWAWLPVAYGLVALSATIARRGVFADPLALYPWMASNLAMGTALSWVMSGALPPLERLSGVVLPLVFGVLVIVRYRTVRER